MPLEMYPTKIVRTQLNHIFASVLTFIKILILKINRNMNHCTLKYQINFLTLRSAYEKYTGMADLIKNYNFA
jgi:hypothetical protein